MRKTSLTLAALAATSLLALTACSGNGSTSGTGTPVVTETATASGTAAQPSGTSTTGTTSPQPTTATDTTTNTGDVTGVLGDPDLADKQLAPEGEFTGSVTGVRMADHAGFTRVVFDIGGTTTPGWWTFYSDEPLQQASGLVVDIAGDSYLNINLEGIAMPFDASVPGVDVGSFGGTGIVEDVQLTSIFEARAQFILGLSGAPREYSMTLLQNPTRVVVDVVH